MDPIEIRKAVAEVEREFLHAPPPAELRLAWSRLIRSLALEPARAQRYCPHCGRPGMAEATLCGFCWKKLDPLHTAQSA